MLDRHFSWRLICLFATAVGLVGFMPKASSIQEPPATLWSGQPSKELWWRATSYAFVAFNNGDLIGRISYLTAERKVRIHWAHKPSGVDLIQAIPTPYWPTAIAMSRAGSDLLVAGKRRANTNTVIEVWDLIPPVVLQDHSGNVERLMAQPIQGISTLHDASVFGQDMVRFMAPRPGFPQQLLVQFWDSKAICSITTDSEPGSLAVLVSKTGGAPFIETRLGDPFSHLSAAEHLTHGYVVILSNEHNILQPSSPLVIKDSNKDGVFDGALVPSMEQWVSLGFADASNYANE